MIDWYFVFSNSLWIFGLSVVLAAFSYHHWLAGERGRRLRQQFREPGWILPFAAGMFLTSVGLGMLESARWWERIIWLALAVSFAWLGWWDGWRPLRRKAKLPDEGGQLPPDESHG
jgi:hypothetical protein